MSKQNSQEIVKSDKSKTKTSETEKKNCKNTKVNTINEKTLPDSKLRVGGNSKSFRISLRKYKSIRKYPVSSWIQGKGCEQERKYPVV